MVRVFVLIYVLLQRIVRTSAPISACCIWAKETASLARDPSQESRQFCNWPSLSSLSSGHDSNMQKLGDIQATVGCPNASDFLRSLGLCVQWLDARVFILKARCSRRLPRAPLLPSHASTCTCQVCAFPPT